MKIRPLQDRILVKRVDEEETTSGGIIIPDSAKEKPQEGQVVAVGPGKTLDSGTVQEVGVNPGDRILFSKYAGTDVNVDGDEHIIIREDDVLGVIRVREIRTWRRKFDFRPGSALARCSSGVDQTRERGACDAGAEGPQRGDRQELRFSDGDQGRRHGGEGRWSSKTSSRTWAPRW